MSRSYKKTPIVKYDYLNRKKAKKMSNSFVRHYSGIINSGMCYKKICRIEIYEYISRETLNKALIDNRDYQHETEERAIEEWKRRFYRK